MRPRLVLASQSPLRKELLAAAGFDFIVRVRPVKEVRAKGERAIAYVRRLAREKAEASWAASLETTAPQGALRDKTREIVLGADTIVVVGGRVLEKPANVAQARAMLRLLSGREHTVITGICLRHAGGRIVDSASTKVHLARLTKREIEEYVASGEPMDKAGAYAIQGLASKFIDSIGGCYFNVVGLPVPLVYRHWKALAGS